VRRQNTAEQSDSSRFLFLSSLLGLGGYGIPSIAYGRSSAQFASKTFVHGIMAKTVRHEGSISEILLAYSM
ncbi:UNVERIFIED_CONTAM: hypothetical protein NY603_29625, partial [Bacteroidetes bacterium 56_B9]